MRSRAIISQRPTAWPAAFRHRLGVSVLYGLLLLGYLGWQCQPANLQVFSYGYDEGVYAQTARAVQEGAPLYAEVFSAQPPLLPYLLAGLFGLADSSIAAARGALVLLSLLALAGVALLASRGGGWPAGLGAMGALALSPDFQLHARQLGTEVPALAFATLALGLAFRSAARRPTRRRRCAHR